MLKIGGFFGRSAWGPLWEHLDKAAICVDLLKSSTEEFIAGNLVKLQDFAKKVTKYEREADQIKENIRQRLSRSVFSSIERSEIMAWLRQQDGIADSCEDIVKMYSIRKTKVVKGLEPSLRKLVLKVCLMSKELVTAVRMFCDIEAKEYTRQEINDLIKIIEKTQKGKDEVDNLQMDFLRTLFKLEKKMDPVSIFFLRDAADKIARVADRIENVGDIVRHMLVK